MPADQLELKRHMVAAGIPRDVAHVAAGVACDLHARDAPPPPAPAHDDDGLSWMERQLLTVVLIRLDRLARTYQHTEALALIREVSSLIERPHQ